MNVTVNLDTRSTERAFQQLKDRAPIAIARALNRAGASAKTVMVREVAKDLGTKAGDIRDRIGIMEALAHRLQVTLTASSKRIPLIDFRARGPEPSRGKGRGVSARLPGGVGRYPHAFIATLKSGHRGVFQRTSKSRLPITQLHGPSVARSFTKHVQVGITRGVEQLIKNVRSELRFALSRAA